MVNRRNILSGILGLLPAGLVARSATAEQGESKHKMGFFSYPGTGHTRNEAAVYAILHTLRHLKHPPKLASIELLQDDVAIMSFTYFYGAWSLEHSTFSLRATAGPEFVNKMLERLSHTDEVVRWQAHGARFASFPDERRIDIVLPEKIRREPQDLEGINRMVLDLGIREDRMNEMLRYEAFPVRSIVTQEYETIGEMIKKKSAAKQREE